VAMVVGCGHEKNKWPDEEGEMITFAIFCWIKKNRRSMWLFGNPHCTLHNS
jgi:hypothetical protein